MKKVVRLLFFIFITLFVIAQIFVGISSESNNEESFGGSDCEEYEMMDSTHQENPFKNIWRSWLDQYSGNNYCLDYTVSSADERSSQQFRNEMEYPAYESDYDYWGAVYRKLYDQDKDRLTALQDSILAVIRKREFTESESIHYLVSMVQDIPYHYIMPESCDGHTDHPCVPYQRFGILSPVEFLYQLTGDCDTRTVLLYSLLRNLNFHPVIVNSVEYGHSMLAIDIPTGGDYIDYRGQRFYFWETTATGWQPGMLPPDMNNVDYWNIALHYED